MILMCLGAVISMIVFVKLCARHTPMARSRYPHRGGAIITAPAVWVAEHWPEEPMGPEGPPPPYSSEPEEYSRRPRDPFGHGNPSHSRWAWPQDRAPGSRRPRRPKDLHSANGIPPTARGAKNRNPEDLTLHPNARKRPLPPLHPKISMRSSSEPEETAIKLTPIFLHDPVDNGNRQSNSNAQPGPSDSCQTQNSRVSRFGVTKP